MVDMAHIAGLVAAGLHQNPVPYADVVTTTTHKTLRGPRGGVIMCKEEHAKAINKAIFPGTQGGPLMHVIAAKAVCFGEALKPEFKEYQQQVVNNAKALADALIVCEINEELLDAPESINGAPYDAWFIKVKEVSEKEELLSPSEYEAFVASEQ